MAQKNAIYIGIRGSVLALDPATGTTLWEAPLTGATFVNVVLQDDTILAATKGEMFALDPHSGRVIWNNKLKGYGTGFVTIAGAAQSPVSAAIKEQQDSDAGGAAAAVAAG